MLFSLFSSKADSVVVGVPLGEWSSVDLDDAVLDKGVSSDKFVIGCIVDDIEDSGFSGDCL